MYTFAVVVLMALAIVKVVDFVMDFLPDMTGVRTLITFVLSIGAVWLLDYSLFDQFGVAIRNHATGVWLTGFMVAGATSAWRALFGYLTHDHATLDETLGDHRPLRKVA
jgi:hypothetical protein